MTILGTCTLTFYEAEMAEFMNNLFGKHCSDCGTLVAFDWPWPECEGCGHSTVCRDSIPPLALNGWPCHHTGLTRAALLELAINEKHAQRVVSERAGRRWDDAGAKRPRSTARPGAPRLPEQDGWGLA